MESIKRFLKRRAEDTKILRDELISILEYQLTLSKNVPVEAFKCDITKKAMLKRHIIKELAF